MIPTEEDWNRLGGRVTVLEDRQIEMSKKLDLNTEVTLQVRDSVKDMVEGFNTVKGGYKFAASVAKLAQPFIWVFGVAVSGYAGFLVAKVWLFDHIARLFGLAFK